MAASYETETKRRLCPTGQFCGHRQAGYVLIVTGIMASSLFGAAALAIDIGRMYIAKNEAQSFVDAAAIDAALELNATFAGFQSAVQVVNNSTNRWNFRTSAFAATQVEFSTSQAGPWEASPTGADGYRFVRVQTTVDVPIAFMRVLGHGPTSPVEAVAIAGQIEKTSFREGLFPFSPFAHPPGTRTPGHDSVSGLTPGESYTIRWGAGVGGGNPHSACPSDNLPEMRDIASAGGGEERGFIESTSADLIRRTIVFDYQTVFRQVGDSVAMTGGAKQTQKDSLVERVRQDSDRTSVTFSEYFNGGNPLGNGRRLVACPINLGEPGGYQIIQVAGFFLQREEDYLAALGGNKAFCAEYVGTYVQGGRGRGAGGPGYYVVRLVQ